MDNREVIILNVIACLWYDNHWIQDIRNDGWPLISRIPKVQITWLVHGWWRSTHNEQPRHQDFQSLDGGSWHREVLPPLMISEVTSQLPFADSLYREQFSGVLAGHHSWNVGYSIHPEKQLMTRATHWFLLQSFFQTRKVMIPGHAKRKRWGNPVCVTATSEHCHLIDLLVLLTIGQQVDCLASLPEKGVDSMISIWHHSWGKPLIYCPQNHKCKCLKISSNGLAHNKHKVGDYGHPSILCPITWNISHLKKSKTTIPWNMAHLSYYISNKSVTYSI